MVVYCFKCGTKNTGRSSCYKCSTLLINDIDNDGIPEYSRDAVKLLCTRCNTFNRVTFETNCKNCGGPLPEVQDENSRISRGKVPTPPPRKIPEDYVNRINKQKKWYNQLKNLEIFKNGIATEGELADIYINTSRSINGKNPWIIEYEFETKSGKFITSKKQTWNKNNQFRKINDLLWVLYKADNPYMNVIWPPLD
ncbi:MAG: hypothetical protein DRJ10_03560 [Bacteroidetes bacterium]|nr:MAG: hypothetical protein DRJ10_03560 [Bacteroidota bacterium]